MGFVEKEALEKRDGDVDLRENVQMRRGGELVPGVSRFHATLGYGRRGAWLRSHVLSNNSIE